MHIHTHPNSDMKYWERQVVRNDMAMPVPP